MVQVTMRVVDALVHLSRHPLKNQELERLPQKDAPERVSYYRFLYHWIKMFRPAVALEIGVERGYASAFMVAAASTYGGTVIGIDINESIKIKDQVISLNQIVSRFGDYHFIHGDTTDGEVWLQVDGLVKRWGKIGLVFQDSSHHYRASLNEWQLYSPMLDSPALWLCDDITPAFHDPNIDPPGKGMVEYFESLPGEKKLYPNVLHRGNTQGVVIV